MELNEFKQYCIFISMFIENTTIHWVFFQCDKISHILSYFTIAIASIVQWNVSSYYSAVVTDIPGQMNDLINIIIL